MGWTFYHATHYNGHGIDRKAECDAYFIEGLNEGHYKIEKSAMVGSVYYAAVRTLLKYVGKDEKGESIYEPLSDSEQEVWGAIFLTSVNSKDYYNFGYKNMSEDMGPYECDCPNSILKLLSPTEDEWSLAWRKKCKDRNAKRKILNKLPIGTVIEVDDKAYTKSICGNKTLWLNWFTRTYIKPKDILRLGYKVRTKEETVNEA